jgi:hypothetical protein
MRLQVIVFVLSLLLVSTASICNGFSQEQQKVSFRDAPSHQNSLRCLFDRRSFLISSLVMTPAAVGAVVPPSRDVDVGGGFDLLGGARLSEKDALYPEFIEGLWICERVVTQTEGDSFQAESAWRALGGGKLQQNRAESFQTRFIRSPLVGDAGVVQDRGFEIASRAKSSSVTWNENNPNELVYDKARLTVVQRTVEVPSDKGFGFNELYRVEDGPFTRAVQVKRRYRRAFDANGDRIVEGLEIMKTFRVLDGVAGTEFPTSTTKSQIRLVRP